MEAVDCRECGFRYDSDDNAFCPRCGSEGRAPEPAATMASVDRADPTRRRVQAAGVMLVALFGIMLLGFATVALSAEALLPTYADQIMTGQPGGDLVIQVKDDAAAVEGAAVAVRSPDGTLLSNGTTDATGMLRFDGVSEAVVNVTVEHTGSTFTRRAISLPGEATTVSIDVAHDAAASDELVGVKPILKALYYFLAFLILLAAFAVWAGVSAIRLKQRPVAMAGAGVGTMIVVILVVASPNLGTMLLLLLTGLALAFIVSGRRHFA